MNYYNEHDPSAAEWLRQLILAGAIPAGEVDCRCITKVSPDDLRHFTQCHFFAGIGGWPAALDLAEVDPTRPIWTASLPCQPFSGAGLRRGVADERHLWPVFSELARECNPPVILGEQVASDDGRAWLAGVRTDLEAMGYAVGAADLCAAGVGAPHIRQRLYWVAYSHSHRRQQAGTGDASPRHAVPVGSIPAGGLGDALLPGLEGQSGHEPDRDQRRRVGAYQTRPASPADHWRDAVPWACIDGKIRRVGRGVRPVADGFPARVGLLRGYGNAIVPPLAATFIRAAGLRPG